MRKPPGTLSLKKFGLGNLLVEKVWTKNTLSENTLSENTQSENTLSKNKLSENKLSENTLWENTLSEDTLSSTFHVEQPETLIEWKFESVTNKRTD